MIVLRPAKVDKRRRSHGTEAYVPKFFDILSIEMILADSLEDPSCYEGDDTATSRLSQQGNGL